MRKPAPAALGLASVIGLAGCLTPPGEADVRALAAPILASAASQVKSCYRTPRVSHSGRLIVTTLRVRVTEQGFPDGIPTIVSQQGVNRANSVFAGRMAEAAIAAVMRCSPLRLSPELYRRGWNEFELTFSPVASA